MSVEVITYEDARATQHALSIAAESVKVRQYAYVLKAQAAEWHRAMTDFAAMEGEAAIELAGTLMPGMFIVGSNPSSGLPEWREVLRRTRGGDHSYEIESLTPQRVWRTFGSAMSPVTVRR